MTETMKKMFRKLGVLSILVGMLLAMSVTVQAAPNYKKIYGNYIKKGTATVTVKYDYGTIKGSYKDKIKIKYFRLLDINRDGTKELLTSEDSQGQWFYVFTIKKGKVKFIGNNLNKYSNGIRYEKKYKGLVLANGGAGTAGDSIWKISKNALKESYSYQVEYTSEGKKYYLNGKKVSNKKWKAGKKKYFAGKNIKTYKLYKNTGKNRTRYLK